MSEVFEGIVCQADPDLLSQWAKGIAGDAGFCVEGMSGNVCVLYRSDPRSSGAFSPHMENLGARMAEKLGQALLVRYDSRIGHRSSIVFRVADRREIGELDELFVPLDEAGMPMVTHPPLSAGELKQGEEYETVKNAIQLGLDELGVDVWEELYGVMTR